jgi:hypothetical protein
VRNYDLLDGDHPAGATHVKLWRPVGDDCFVEGCTVRLGGVADDANRYTVLERLDEQNIVVEPPLRRDYAADDWAVSGPPPQKERPEPKPYCGPSDGPEWVEPPPKADAEADGQGRLF